MKSRLVLFLFAIFRIAPIATAQWPGATSTPGATAPPAKSSSLVDRVGNTAFIQLRAQSFDSLTPKQKELAYWLTRASIAIDPIIYDQLSKYGLREKRLLEEIVAHPQGIDAVALRKITDYSKLFWANRGNHNDTTSQKFLPDFSFEQLQQAALRAQRNGAFKSPYADLPPIDTPSALNHELDHLKASIFDPHVEPMATAKSPEGGKDIIQASSATFYQGVTLADLKGFTEHYRLNSTVVKEPDGQLTEEVWRAGTPDGSIPPGMYATYLKRANEYLERGRAVADPKQAQVIADLERFYQTGDFNDWLKFDADWVRDNTIVDFANGFIEVYRDARGAKGSSQSFVSVTDRLETEAMVKLAQNAGYFEARAPWPEQYKKKSFTQPAVKAVETVIETGDFQVTTIGDNLPNENEIHEKYGTKNFLFTAASHALTQAAGFSGLKEFGSSSEVIARDERYADQAEDLMTALHEVIGHGSGKLSPRLATTGAEPALKEYFSTLEEARADLMALWNAWDPKLKELGLVRDQNDVAKTMYDSAARVALTQLERNPRGDTIEEDHERDRQLIARYIQDQVPGSIEQYNRDGKTYVRVADYQKMKRGVGMLLGELMRIKAEGDYNAIKALVDEYGVHFNPALRDQVVARYKKLNIPTYWAGVNPWLAGHENGGSVSEVRILYPRDEVRQYLSYAAMYSSDIVVPPAKAAGQRPRLRRFSGDGAGSKRGTR